MRVLAGDGVYCDGPPKEIAVAADDWATTLVI
jgi:hypothetical protein